MTHMNWKKMTAALTETSLAAQLMPTAAGTTIVLTAFAQRYWITATHASGTGSASRMRQRGEMAIIRGALLASAASISTWARRNARTAPSAAKAACAGSMLMARKCAASLLALLQTMRRNAVLLGLMK
jgi:hypothetical protein